MENGWDWENPNDLENDEGPVGERGKRDPGQGASLPEKKAGERTTATTITPEINANQCCWYQRVALDRRSGRRNDSLQTWG